MRANSIAARSITAMACSLALIATLGSFPAAADSAGSPKVIGGVPRIEVVPWVVTGHTANSISIRGRTSGLCGFPHPPGFASLKWSGRINGMRKAVIRLHKNESAYGRDQLGVCESAQIVDTTVKLKYPVGEVALFDGSAEPAERRSLCKGLIPAVTSSGGIHCGYKKRAASGSSI